MSGERVSFHQHDWERIQRLGVHAGVASPDRNATKVATGMALAHATLQATKEVVPTIPTIKGVHYIMFESVHPWAGTFRKPGEEVRAGDLVCSLAENVMGDLMKLRREMINHPLKGSRQYKAEVLAFYHASLLAIHPFLDGNGRVSRTILDFQTRKLLGHPLSRAINRAEYVEGLRRAQEDGQLQFLAKLLSRNDLIVARSVTDSAAKSRRVYEEDELLVSKPVLSSELGRGRGGVSR
jgi:fido (protein-threonine AMPylation protein)